MTVRLNIPGKPTGKARHRTTYKNGYAQPFTPEKTENYEAYIKYMFYAKHKSFFFDPSDYLSVVVKAFYPIPKSASKVKVQMMLNDEILPTAKPDGDNVLKIVCDSLNTVAYRDDSHFVHKEVFKYYDHNPRIEITITNEVSEIMKRGRLNEQNQ